MKKTLIFVFIFIIVVSSIFGNVKAQDNYYDVIVIGGGTGGTSAAIQAARMGSKVLLIEETDWLGGQMTSAGVSTMDGNYNWNSGIYKEFINKIKSYYLTKGINSISTCYWSVNSYCFEPNVAKDILTQMVSNEQNITVLYNTEVLSVLKNENLIEGVVTNNGIYLAKVFVDGTEYGDFMVLAGARYRLANKKNDEEGFGSMGCVQDITYVAIIKEYSQVPDNLKISEPPPLYTQEIENKFKEFVSQNGNSTLPIPVNWNVHVGYRRIPNSQSDGSKTELNWANDFSDFIKMSPRYVEDKEYREEINCMAKLRTIQFIYYVQNILGKQNWSISTDEGYANSQYNQNNLCSVIPDNLKTIELNMPLIPYVREARRGIGLSTLTGKDIKRVGNPPMATVLFTDSIAIGDYPDDLHNCLDNSTFELDLENSGDRSNGGGAFQVPIQSLISENIDNLIFSEKNISASRISNGAIRLQPITMLVGQGAGALAHYSSKDNLPPKYVDFKKVQDKLLRSGSVLVPFQDMNTTTPQFVDMQMMYNRKIMSGYGGMIFGGDDLLTRNQMAVIIVNTLKLPTTNPTGIFSDVPKTDPYAKYVETIYLNGIVGGCGVNPLKYCPNSYVTNAEMSVFILRVWNKINPQVVYIQNPVFLHYSDIPRIHYASGFTEGLAENGITWYCDISTSKFCLNNNVKRRIVSYLINSIFVLEE